MDITTLELLAKNLQILTNDFVLLDVDDQQDVDRFTQSFLKLKEESKTIGFEFFDTVCTLIIEACAKAPSSQPKDQYKVINVGLQALQDLIDSKLHDKPLPDEKDIRNLFDQALGIGKQLSAKLSDIQLQEIPSFISGAFEKIAEAENALLSIEAAGASAEKLEALFRIFHTFKGESGLLGIANIGTLAQELEKILAEVRAGQFRFDTVAVSTILQTIDSFKAILHTLGKNIEAGLQFDVASVVVNLKVLHESHTSAPKETSAPQTSDATPAQAAPGGSASFVSKIPRVNVAENKDMLHEFITEASEHLQKAEQALIVLEGSPDNADEINTLFRAFHTIKGIASFLALEDITSLSHTTETMLDLVRKGVLKINADIIDTALVAIDCMRKLLGLLKEQVENNGTLTSQYLDITQLMGQIDRIIQSCSQPQKAPIPRLGEILLSKGVIDEIDLNRALDKQTGENAGQRLGEILVGMNSATPLQVERALQEQKQGTLAEQAVRISIQKLDNLIDMVGELVITGSQVIFHDTIRSSQDSALQKNLNQLNRIIRDVQDISMGMRLVTILPLFQKMLRLARDISKKSGKKIEVRFSGENTEVDKNIVDLVADPVMHMVRNSIDHGIEDQATRAARGKPAFGTVKLNAYHQSGNVVIEISDDGGGLNKEKILTKAREKGFLKQGESISEDKIFNFIFEPGFSTATAVTDISGRGVGMDVVKRNVEALRGKIDIVSQEGVGTTFSIKLPLTLAVIDGIILTVGPERFIVPLFSIVEFFKPKRSDITYIAGVPRLIMVHGRLLPLVQLDKFFRITSDHHDLDDATICIVDSNEGDVAFVVDKVLGQQQVVIKSLGDSLKKAKGLLGATIMGDGKVGLILDVDMIAEGAKETSEAA